MPEHSYPESVYCSISVSSLAEAGRHRSLDIPVYNQYYPRRFSCECIVPIKKDILQASGEREGGVGLEGDCDVLVRRCPF